MSQKNKTLRAFLHQKQNPTIKQTWDAAWKHAQKTFHAQSMQDMEKKLSAAQAECGQVVEALEQVMYCNEVGFLPVSVQESVSKALSAYRKGAKI